jgi:hypothetical protein
MFKKYRGWRCGLHYPGRIVINADNPHMMRRLWGDRASLGNSSPERIPVRKNFILFAYIAVWDLVFW